MTSFRVVSKVRGILNNRLGMKNLKVGHAGTLDPLATGVLLVCTGKATKNIDTLQAGTKEYIATLRLGATTPSFDRETDEDATYPTSHITRPLVEQVLQQFVGRIEQIPPRFSAVKVDGKRAFKLARKGEDIDLKPKVLVIDELELLACRLGVDLFSPHAINIKQMTPELLAAVKAEPADAAPSITIRIVCSKGTYIRALARDIGAALGSGAYLTALKRTRIGDYHLNQCLDIEQFETWVDAQGVIKPDYNR
jgi:tRNA pseudouridine55 synthase